MNLDAYGFSYMRKHIYANGHQYKFSNSILNIIGMVKVLIFIRIIIFGIIISVLSFVVTGNANKEIIREKISINDYTNNFEVLNTEIPVIAWAPGPQTNYPTLKDFKDVKECGFNTIIYYDMSNIIDSVSKLAQQNNLKIILGSKKFNTDQFEKYILSQNANDNIIGWFLKDEPFYKDLPALKQTCSKIRDISKNKFIYINLNGGVNKTYTGNCKTMKEYLDTINTLLQPDIWSYDCYPISIKENKIIVNYNSFYSNFEIFSQISKITKRPFWAFCQSTQFKNSIVERPAANLSFLRFEAFSALAYGAQGIVYWAYRQRIYNDEEVFSALVDLEGNRYPAWYAAKEVNDEIKLYSKVFLQTSLIDCGHTGVNKYKDTKHIDKEFGPLKDIEGDKAGFLISHLTTDGVDYIVIVNHDVENNQRIELKFFDKKRVFLLETSRTKSGLSINEKKIGVKLKQNIPAGGYIILKLSDD